MSTFRKLFIILMATLGTNVGFAQVNGGLVINEFMASNDSSVADEEGQFDDWIEIRNNSATEWISLNEWTLTDTLGILDKWKFPQTASIEPHGYMIIWADEDGGQGELHANFKLDADGEELYLVDKFGTIVDQIIFVNQETDKSFARKPNGTGNFEIGEPTFGFNNDNTSAVEHPLSQELNVFPNPTTGILQIENNQAHTIEYALLDVLGKVILSGDSSNNTELDLTGLTRGMYVLTINGSSFEKIVKN